jgi:hypothetical protein
MQHTLSCPPSGIDDCGTSPAFNVVIAYEDFDTGKHAKRTYDFLTETVGRECRFTNEMWKFDVLRIPKLWEMARADAAAADLVVISCHGDDLPAHTREWIESWLGGPTTPLALVALFDRPLEEVAKVRAVRDYLADAARRGNMEFFAQPDQWPGAPRSRECSVFHKPKDRGQPTLRTLAGVFQQDLPASRWNAFD